MKVLAVADFHGDRVAARNIAKVISRRNPDLVLVAGDLTDIGSLEDAKNILEILGRDVYYVPGNCDPIDLARGAPDFEKGCIHGTAITRGDISLVGLGGSTITPFSTPFELTEEELEDLLDKAYSGVKGEFILLTHDAPWNTKLDTTWSKEHVGSKSIRRFIGKEKPTLHLCGHIHESAGIDKIGSTICVNVGPVSQKMYAWIDIAEDVKAEHLYIPSE